MTCFIIEIQVGIFDLGAFIDKNSDALINGFRRGQTIDQIFDGLLDNHKLWIKFQFKGPRFIVHTVDDPIYCI